MVLADVVAAVLMLGMCTFMVLDSRPARGVLYVFARWQHRRRVGSSAPDQHAHALTRTLR